MKLYISILTFSLLSLSVLGQIYCPVIELNKTWDQSNEDHWGCSFAPYRYEFTENDTILNGHTYNMCNIFKLLGESGPGIATCPPYSVDTIIYSRFFMREDSIERKVYIYDDSYDSYTDQLLYDFSLEIGDTLQSQYASSYPAILDSITLITLNTGESRKQYWLTTDFYCVSYIEGIGGARGLGIPLYIFEHSGSTLFCVKNDNEDLLGSLCNIFIVGNEIIAESKIVISPNPFSDTFSIDIINIQLPVLLEIMNLNGSKIYSNQLNEEHSIISLYNIKPGLYIYSIVSESIIYNGKLIKL